MLYVKQKTLNLMNYTPRVEVMDEGYNGIVITTHILFLNQSADKKDTETQCVLHTGGPSQLIGKKRTN